MNTEDITEEIVSIRDRIEELDTGVRPGVDLTITEERKQLEERLRYLRDLLSADGEADHPEQDQPAKPDEVHYLPPA